jgi:hypothetical protein
VPHEPSAHPKRSLGAHDPLHSANARVAHEFPKVCLFLQFPKSPQGFNSDIQTNLIAILEAVGRVIASSDRRNGEFLQVHSATATELDLERPGETGPSYRYRGSLSGDGQMLTGDWAENGGARLNAPDKFQKVPG